MRTIYTGLLILITLLPTISVFSQSVEDDRLEKYWTYRKRFLTDFVSVCDDPNGACNDLSTRSVPFCDWQHEIWHPATNPYINNVCSAGQNACTGHSQSGASTNAFDQCCPGYEYFGNMYITPAAGFSIPADIIQDYAPSNPSAPNDTEIQIGADGSSHLGYYLAVLATEYRLLADHGQSTSATEWELYYGLRAFNRLDISAEHLYGRQYPDTEKSLEANGFFARSDHPLSYFDGLPLNLLPGRVSSSLIDIYEDLHAINSTTNGTCKDLLDRGTMSQDQIIHFLVGCASIVKFVDPTVTVFGMNPVDEARDIADRIGRYMQQVKYRIRVAMLPTDPDYNDVDVHAGAATYFNAYAMAEAIDYIVNGDATTTTSSPYHTVFSFGLGRLLWYLATSQTYLQFARDDNLVMPQVLAAIAKLDPLWGSPHPTWIWQSAIGAQYKTEIYPLFRQALHGSYTTIADSRYHDIMDTAPCEGPMYEFGPNNLSAPAGWHARMRWLYPSRQLKHPNTPNPARGRFNGLDYMFLYNLYHIVHPNDLPGSGYYNGQRDGSIAGTFPDPPNNSCIGCNQNQKKFYSYSNIEGELEVLDHPSPFIKGNVTVKAQESIRLLPGSLVENGAYFKAYIEDITCNAANDDVEKMAPPGLSDIPDPEPDPQLQEFLDNMNMTLEDLDRAISGESELDWESIAQALRGAECIEKLEVIPNPTSGLAKISFDIKASANVRLRLFDSGMRFIKEIHAGSFSSGTSFVPSDFSTLPKGLYFIKMAANESTKTVKLMLQ